MSTKMKRFLITMLVLVMSVSIFVMPAQAAEAVTATIPVNLKLTGTRPATADIFSIVLEAKDASNPMPQGASAGKYTLPMSDEGTGTDAAAFQIPFDRVGIYEYTVYQKDAGDPDCYQDDSVYDVTISVTNSATETGKLDITVAIRKQGSEIKLESIDFENRYANPVTVPLTAIKTLNSKTPKDNQFIFVLKDAAGNEVERVYNQGQNVTFTPFVYDDPEDIGTYTYTISEVKGTSKKIIYDKNVYTVTIEVDKDENGDYEAKVSYKKGTKDYEGTPKFANKTKSSSPVTGDMFRMGLWVSLLVLSGVGLVVLIVLFIKKNKK